MLDHLNKIIFMEKDHINGIMVIFIMDNGYKEKWMGLDNFIGNLDIHIKDNIKMILNMEKGKWYGIHIEDIEEIGLMEISMDMDNKSKLYSINKKIILISY